MEAVFFHVDLDAFFASVEQLDHPEFRGKPVIVGGLPGDRRSVVSTASYEARKFGVHSAMPTARAYQLCPHGIFVRGRMNRYQEKSLEVMSIFNNYSPDVVQISVDEAFLNLTGTQRLLGQPYDVAVRLKQQVKEETGLTVSIGIAPTMYLAKISSGLHKPDGLTVVLPGQEESFMLALPLEKVWGVGTKTLEHLHNAGLTTTRSIYDKSERLLQGIFGDNTGSFLYNAVRGNKGMTFGDEAKNHSISSETTFDFDLTDRYAIDTALLSLSQTVAFRLHREHFHSRSVSLKIRYEDFTTVSIQETGERCFISADDLYERCIRLFTTKYDQGRGIRLLGVAAQNVEDDSIPVQNDLFDFTDKKKAKVEKTILAFEDKHPGTKISKARTLGKNSVLFIAACLSFFSLLKNTLYAESQEQDASGAGAIVFSDTVPLLPDVSSDEAPVSLFNYSTDSANVEFLAQGYWQAEITGSTAATFGFGNAFALSLGTPVFSQKVDLTLWFMLNKSWYFESSFADGFAKNTVAAGYLGTGVLKSARVANRKIVFPSYYSSSLMGCSIGGGDNSAPGVQFHFEDSTWKADAVIRYDMLSQKSKLFYGKHSVTTTTISPSSYITGRQFILPSSAAVSSVTAIYVESSTGIYKDGNGRTYKKLSSSDYLLIPAQKMIIISSDAGAARTVNSVLPAVLITFDSSMSTATLQSQLGSYGTPQSPGAAGTFLGDLQRYFGSATDNPPALSSYAYTLFTNLDGNTALYLQYPVGFSPFAVCSRYLGGTSTTADAIVVHASTSLADTDYSVIDADDDASLVSSNFFSGKLLWLVVTPSDSTAADYTSPRIRFPFASEQPSFYLGYSESTDLSIEMRTYMDVSSFSIGTDVAAGTVTVTINDITDYGALFDSETGIVSPSRPISDSDKVLITWSEDSGTMGGGAIAAGLGFLYAFTPSLTGDASFTSRWTLSPTKSFADDTSAAPGFASLTAGISYQKNSLCISTISSFSIHNSNTTGKYRILGMNDDSGDDIYLSASAGIPLPAGFAPVLNERDWSSYTSLNTSYDGSPSKAAGVSDSSISGYKIPLTWDFSSFTKGDEYAWAAVAIDLGSAGASLANSSTFSIALQEDAAFSNYQVYLQLGVTADDDFTVEDTTSIPTYLISKHNQTDRNGNGVLYAFVPGLNASEAGSSNGTKQLGSGWQQVTVSLDKVTCSRLISQHDARLIIVAPLADRDESDFASNGTLYLGPWEHLGSSFATSYDSDVFTLTLSQQTDDTLTGSDISLFNTGTTNTVTTADWKATALTSTDIPTAANGIYSFSRSFDALSLSDYKNLNFYFKYDVSRKITSPLLNAESYSCEITLDRPYADGTYSPALTLSLDSSLFSLSTESSQSTLADGKWHLVTISLSDKSVSIDNTTIAADKMKLFINTAIVPVHFKATVNTLSQNDNAFFADGTFSIDELYLSDSSAQFIAQNKTSFSYKKDVVFGTPQKSYVKNLSVTASGNMASAKQLAQSAGTTNSISGNSSLSFTAFGISCSFDGAASYSSDEQTEATLSSSATNTTGLTTAGYTVRTETPLFTILSLSSSFRTSPISSSRSADSSLSLSFASFDVPLQVQATTQSAQSLWSQTQKSTGTISFTGKWNSASAQISLSQKKTASSDTDNSFGDDFISAQSLSFSAGDGNASRRTIDALAKYALTVPSIKIKPAVSFETMGQFASSLLTDTSELIFAFPFTISSNAFTASWSKKTGGSTSYTTASSSTAYVDDGAQLLSSLQQRDWYWKSLPFADLFIDSLSSDIAGTVSDAGANSLYYTGTYSLSYKRPPLNSYADILIPSTTTLSFARDVKVAQSTADTYQLKLSLSSSALNLFGTLGSYHTFGWYEQDAFLSSVSATVKLPHDDSSDLTMMYSGYIECDFYLHDADYVKSGLEGQFEDTRNWSAKTTAAWKRKGRYSPLVAMVGLFKPSIGVSKFKLTRTDSVNYAISSSTSDTGTDTTRTLKNEISIAHLLEVLVSKMVSLNGSISGTYACTADTIMSLSCTATLGGKVSF